MGTIADLFGDQLRATVGADDGADGAAGEPAPASSPGSKADLVEEAAMEAVLEESGLEPGSARAELTLRGDLDLDDLGLCAVVARFERAANARCPDAEIEQWRTLGDLLSAARALGGDSGQ